MTDRYVVHSNINYALHARGFWLSTIGMTVAVLVASLQKILDFSQGTVVMQYGFHATLIMDALKSDTVMLMLPLLCTLPFATSYVDDVKSGFLKLYLHRSGVKPYLKGKLIACGLSGGFSLVLGILVAYVLALLVFLPMEPAPNPAKDVTPYFAQLLAQAVLFFVSGAFWALIGFLFASLTMSKYMAYASPFIMYYILIILHERYFQDLYVLYPKEWIFPQGPWFMGNLGVVLLLGGFICVVCLAFTITAERRMGNA